jgi:hypothetical protein
MTPHAPASTLAGFHVEQAFSSLSFTEAAMASLKAFW